uniref:Uncharacterized protein n=1 Tax=Candidatus Kentrum sp. LFY TaxID=2126342 RepID=A0A450WQH3_9GAMM|nr:MAG: hypothetical protein BECKLFY1418C_GA0070996_105612 [Candidatus Kentron sp. LFY]
MPYQSIDTSLSPEDVKVIQGCLRCHPILYQEAVLIDLTVRLRGRWDKCRSLTKEW